jgi:hypothetical protein
MNYAVEMFSDDMTYVPNFMKFSSGLLNLRETQTEGEVISLD